MGWWKHGADFTGPFARVRSPKTHAIYAESILKGSSFPSIKTAAKRASMVYLKDHENLQTLTLPFYYNYVARDGKKYMNYKNCIQKDRW